MKIKYLLIITIFLFHHCHDPFVFGQNELDKKQYSIRSQISETDKLKVFNNFWGNINRLYFDSTFNQKDLVKLRESYQPQVLAAENKFELSEILNKFLTELNSSHLKVSFEINLSGKTLKGMFGENINYKQNDIVFGYGYSTIRFNNELVVANVFKSSAAEQSGVKRGWIQKSCEPQLSTKMVDQELIFTEMVNCIFATETETDKKLTLNSSWFLLPRSNTRRVSQSLAENVLYLKFNQFDKGIGKWIEQQITKYPTAKGVVIDLRDNFGGFRDEVKSSLSIFFPSQTVVGEFIERDLDERLFKVGSNNYYEGHLVVLIDGNSSSGAEIFAAAVQELERGKIIGNRSSGAVLNSIHKGLSNGFKLQIAVRDYKTARGVRLEGNGIKPDLEIPFLIEDFRRNRDPGLEKALEFLRNL